MADMFCNYSFAALTGEKSTFMGILRIDIFMRVFEGVFEIFDFNFDRENMHI